MAGTTDAQEVHLQPGVIWLTHMTPGPPGGTEGCLPFWVKFNISNVKILRVCVFVLSGAFCHCVGRVVPCAYISYIYIYRLVFLDLIGMTKHVEVRNKT